MRKTRKRHCCPKKENLFLELFTCKHNTCKPISDFKSNKIRLTIYHTNYFCKPQISKIKINFSYDIIF